MSKTQIPSQVKQQIWFAAHGRCEFRGCNKRLYTSGVTMEKCNISNYAHIIGDSPDGPRGNELSKTLSKDPSNLILLCPECHDLIDSKSGEKKYTVEVLKSMKKEHEERIDFLTGICPNQKSLVVACGPKLGQDNQLFQKDVLNNIILPERYPLDLNPIEIHMKNTALDESMQVYWQTEELQIETLCRDKVIKTLESGACSHISLFPLGPQPLLIKLGTILNDRYNVQVYQKHREPDTWRWLENRSSNSIIVEEPADKTKEPMLIIALSTQAIKARVLRRFGANASIWTITCDIPGNDMMESKYQLEQFRMAARKVMDDIKNSNPENIDLKIFMAAPASCAVELGRIRMPKADSKWVIFDYSNKQEKDIETITID